MNGCPKVLGTGPCDCADGKWLAGLLARLAPRIKAQREAEAR